MTTMVGLLHTGTSFIPSSSSVINPKSSSNQSSSSSLPSYSCVRGRNNRKATPIEAKVHALSSTMTEGKIISRIKYEGDTLSKGESVVVVESDKADMDMETFYDSYLAAIMVEEGGVAAVGSAIAYLSETEDEIEAPRSKFNSSSYASHVTVEAPTVIQPPPLAALAVIAASLVHLASEGGKRIVASPYAKKL